MSGLRRLTDDERKTARAMAGAMVATGEHKDNVKSSVGRYLVTRGWGLWAATARAREITDAAINSREVS